MRILVAAADSFLGRHIVADLAGRGVAVRAMTGAASARGAAVFPSRVEVVQTDVADEVALRRAFEDVDVLVQPAPGGSGSAADIHEHFVVGTERLLTAMAKSGCRRLVIESSLSVYDLAAVNGVVDEASPLHSAAAIEKLEAYPRAKWQQERIARDFAQRFGWDLTVLRPGFVWGRDHAVLPPLGRVKRGFFVAIGPRRLLPLCHVDNCADVFARAALDPACRGETLNVIDEPGITVWSYLDTYRRRSGERGIAIPVPYRLAKTIVALAYAGLLRFVPRVPSLLVPDRFDARFKPVTYDAQKLRRLLDWTPPSSYETCLDKTHGEDVTARGMPVPLTTGRVRG